MSNQYDRLFDEFDDFRDRMIRAMGVVEEILEWLEKTHPDKPPVSVNYYEWCDFRISGENTVIDVGVFGDMGISVDWGDPICTVATCDVDKLDPSIWKG